MTNPLVTPYFYLYISWRIDLTASLTARMHIPRSQLDRSIDRSNWLLDSIQCTRSFAVPQVDRYDARGSRDRTPRRRHRSLSTQLASSARPLPTEEESNAAGGRLGWITREQESERRRSTYVACRVRVHATARRTYRGGRGNDEIPLMVINHIDRHRPGWDHGVACVYVLASPDHAIP